MSPSVPPLKWTLGRIAAALGGRLVGDGETTITSISTDSRTVGPGALFVAVQGERFDGHRFATDAMRAGAAASLVSDAAAAGDEPRVEVADTSAALRDLAALRRDELDVPVVAVTGSTGKTSTKDMLGSVLPDAWASPRSYNNEVGVPLTILGTPGGSRHVVAEVGSRGVGHISWLLPAVRPDVAVITNLGVVHLESFGTTDRLADAKFELVEGLSAEGVAVLPVDEPRLRRPHNGTTLTFGRSPEATVSCTDVSLDAAARATFTLRTPEGSRRLRLSMAGRHQPLNAAAATAAALAVGVDIDVIVAGLESAAGSPWRMEVHHGRFTVVNDAYNANPTSVAAALETVATMPGRHLAVLGEMLELGPVTAEEHRRIGNLAASLGFHAVIVVGSDPGIVAGAGDRGHAVGDLTEAHDLVRRMVHDGDAVLVKASRAIGLEDLAARLIEEAGA